MIPWTIDAEDVSRKNVQKWGPDSVPFCLTQGRNRQTNDKNKVQCLLQGLCLIGKHEPVLKMQTESQTTRPPLEINIIL